jgi:tetratricopeptide (TPR) repeat protein
VIVDSFDSSDFTDSSAISANLFDDGVQAFKRKDFDRAVLCFKGVLSDNPDDDNCLKNLVNSLFQAGVANFKKKLFEEAIGNFSAIEDYKPEWEQAHVNLANSHLRFALELAKSGDDQAAEYHFLQATESLEPFLVAHYNLSNFYISRKRFKEAYKHLKSLKDLYPNDQEPRLKLAECSRQYANHLITKKNFPSAEKVLRLARRNFKVINQESFDVERGFGIVYFHTDQFSGAADAFRVALGLNPEHKVTRRDLAICLLHIASTLAKNTLHRAEESYQEALALNSLEPKSQANGLVNLGVLYFNHKEFQLAISPLQQALQTNPENKQATNYLVRVHIVLGYKFVAQEDYDGAMDAYGNAVAIDSSSFNALVRLGFVCYLTKNYEMAADWFKRGLGIKPDDLRTQQNYDACLKLSQADEEDLYVMMEDLQVEDLAMPSEIASLPPELSKQQAKEEKTEEPATALKETTIPREINSNTELDILAEIPLESTEENVDPPDVEAPKKPFDDFNSPKNPFDSPLESTETPFLDMESLLNNEIPSEKTPSKGIDEDSDEILRDVIDEDLYMIEDD